MKLLSSITAFFTEKRMPLEPLDMTELCLACQVDAGSSRYPEKRYRVDSSWSLRHFVIALNSSLDLKIESYCCFDTTGGVRTPSRLDDSVRLMSLQAIFAKYDSLEIRGQRLEGRWRSTFYATIRKTEAQLSAELVVLVEDEKKMVQVQEREFQEQLFGTTQIGLCCRQSHIQILSHLALRDSLLHVRTNTKRELGGILLGSPFFSKRHQCYWTYIARARPIGASQSSGTHVRFSAEAIAGALAAEKEGEDGRILVGWYHSHPGLGSDFLSATDIKTHENYYPERWHLAMVIDPTLPKDESVNMFYYDKEKSLALSRVWFIDSGSLM